MNKKTRKKIINILRKASYSIKARGDAKRRTKIDKAVYQCESCGVKMYDGESVKNFQALQEKYPDIIQQKIELDHVIPVIDPQVGFVDWNQFIERLWIEDPNGWQCLCRECHKKKTDDENKGRSR